jgi:hypothetical protein
MAVNIWINALIPMTVPGYTKLISKGANVGKTAVPLPFLARIDPFNAFKASDAGYLELELPRFDRRVGA